MNFVRVGLHCAVALTAEPKARPQFKIYFVIQMQTAKDDRRRRFGRLTTHAWLSTARWVGQSRFGARVFSARNAEPTFENVAERTIENFLRAAAQPIPIGDTDKRAACASKAVVGTDLAYDASVVRASDRIRRERVILFAPGPVTETELRRENLRRAEVLRQRHRRRKHLRWFRNNAVSIVVVSVLLVMAWLVANR
jgi:hypothetical protein